MGVTAGANVVSNGLVFALDAGADANFGCTISTNKYGTTTTFLNGTGSSYEGGSNPTNDIVLLANPSGYSPYVLRQNGNYTEYQINLSTQLASSTTYVLSGWYAKSADYNGSDTMFHCRAFSTSGNHVALGTGIGTTIKTQVVGALTWSYVYTTITTPSDYSNQFDWYVGYGQPSHTGYRYYANLRMEEGTFPTQKNLISSSFATPRNGVTYNTANGGYLVLDGTDDYMDTGRTASQLGVYDADYTFSAWVYPTSLSSDRTMFGTDQTVSRQGMHLVFRSGGIYQGHYGADFNAGTVDVNNWYHITYTYVKSSGTATIYKNGVSQGSGTISSFIGTTNILIGRWAGGYNFSGNGAAYYIWNRALSASEVLQNFNAQRDRFGI